MPLPGGGEGVLLCFTGRDWALNRVSFYGKNYAKGCTFMIRIMQQGVTIERKIIQQGIMNVERHFLEFS